ncbi:hypothetical protein BKA62DRAFT_714384 [Auriculariales sp. MPI-PUGE-AT-0066]|nr:hypothetical protein BKA62DRAFT_714384 [Auriculariales sp. MPI-PUGE-AT-0066]
MATCPSRTERFRLPFELWITVWTSLQTDDRIRVALVSATWRKLILSIPSIWANVHFRICLFTRDQPGRVRYNGVRSNIRAMPDLLRRSVNCALHIFIDVKIRPAIGFVRDLDQFKVILEQHYARLESLHFSTDVIEKIPDFFGSTIQEFGALRSLHCVNTYDWREKLLDIESNDERLDFITYWPDNFHAPNLETITSYPPSSYYMPLAQLQGEKTQFSNLRAITMSVPDRHEFWTIFIALPALIEARLSLLFFEFGDGPIAAAPQDIIARVLGGARRLQVLHLLDIPLKFDDNIFDAEWTLLCDLSLREIHLSYVDATHHEGGSAVPRRGLEILRDIQTRKLIVSVEPEVEFKTSSLYVQVVATDMNTPRVRSLRFSSEVMADVFNDSALWRVVDSLQLTELGTTARGGYGSADVSLGKASFPSVQTLHVQLGMSTPRSATQFDWCNWAPHVQNLSVWKVARDNVEQKLRNWEQFHEILRARL